MLCKLTGKEGKGVKAHLIPRSFHYISDKPSLVMSNNDHPKRLWGGLYDSEIVTAEGEEIFKKLDDYGNKLLIDGRENLKPLLLEGQIVGLRLDEYDYTKLKLFCLSMLWRMSVSSRREVARVNLGSHENEIKNMIINSDAGLPNKYSVIMFRFIEQATRATVLYPTRERVDNINYYRLQFSDYTALIKIDKRKTPEIFASMQLVPNGPLFIFDRSFRKGSEAKVFRHLLSSNEEKLPQWYADAANKSKSGKLKPANSG